jgi:hypothetical protein
MGIVRYFIALFALFSLSATVASAKTPVLGYVVKGELLRQHSELVEGPAATRILLPGGPREVPGEGARQRG